MTAIALNITYPNLFAGSFLVAGQYNPELVQPLTNAKLWILVSADDTKAFPGQNAITERLQSSGVKFRRELWDARWDKKKFQFAYDQITEEHAQVYYTVYAPGSVLTDGPDHGAGHRNTWRFAYTIEPIRKWRFQQYK